METTYLETERMILHKYTPEDLQFLFEHRAKSEIMALLGLSTAEDFIKEQKKTEGGYKTYDRTIVHFKLALKKNKQVVGGAGFHNWYSQHRRAELGYALTVEDAKRQGYMSEAVSTILNYGFTQMNLNRVEAFISPNNKASLRLIEKFAFTQEGHLRQHFLRDDTTEDSFVFSLLREEYVRAHKV
ncbi:MAG: GNAT family N-acetyltransferase [Bacteroidetes bacterium]|nr:GNAT family N-acetyltransferase [Bacteroidota bacterium]